MNYYIIQGTIYHQVVFVPHAQYTDINRKKGGHNIARKLKARDLTLPLSLSLSPFAFSSSHFYSAMVFAAPPHRRDKCTKEALSLYGNTVHIFHRGAESVRFKKYFHANALETLSDPGGEDHRIHSMQRCIYVYSARWLRKKVRKPR